MSEQLTITTALSIITAALEADAIAREAAAERRGRRRMRYLDELAALGKPTGGKKANWLKFCHACGRDISRAAKGVVFCGGCAKRKEP